MNRYTWFSLGKFLKACIITLLLIPISAVVLAAVFVWYNK